MYQGLGLLLLVCDLDHFDQALGLSTVIHVRWEGPVVSTGTCTFGF